MENHEKLMSNSLVKNMLVFFKAVQQLEKLTGKGFTAICTKKNMSLVLIHSFKPHEITCTLQSLISVHSGVKI